MTSPAIPDTSPTHSGPSAAEYPRRIFVMDDSADLVESLAAGLELLGFATRTATTADAALCEMAAWVPHIAFLDLSMPSSSGVQVLQTARGEEWGRDVVMIAMTGWSSDSERKRALEAGFDVFLEKPFDLDELGALLKPFMQAHDRAGAAAPE